MTETKGTFETGKIYYPEDNASVYKMTETQLFKHFGSILSKEFANSTEMNQYIESQKSTEQIELQTKVLDAFNANCRELGYPTTLTKSDMNFIIFLPPKKIEEIYAQQNPLYKIAREETRELVSATVLKSGVILMSDEGGKTLGRSLSATLAHEFGHLHREKIGKSELAEHEIEEGIVEVNAEQVYKKMGIESVGTYLFESLLVKSLYKKFNMKSAMGMSFEDIKKVAEQYYPGSQDGHPDFVWLIEDYLDVMHVINRNSMLISHTKDENSSHKYHVEMAEQIYTFSTKWGLEIL